MTRKLSVTALQYKCQFRGTSSRRKVRIACKRGSAPGDRQGGTVEVRHDEGTANHIGLAPCVGIREGAGEASAEDRAGQPLSRERLQGFGCRRRCPSGRQHGRGRYRERPSDPAWSETLARTDTPCTGTGRSPGWSFALRSGWSAAGRRGACSEASCHSSG